MPRCKLNGLRGISWSTHFRLKLLDQFTIRVREIGSSWSAFVEPVAMALTLMVIGYVPAPVRNLKAEVATGLSL